MMVRSFDCGDSPKLGTLWFFYCLCYGLTKAQEKEINNLCVVYLPPFTICYHKYCSLVIPSWVGALSTGKGFPPQLRKKVKWRVLLSSVPCDLDCWHAGLSVKGFSGCCVWSGHMADMGCMLPLLLLLLLLLLRLLY